MENCLRNLGFFKTSVSVGNEIDARGSVQYLTSCYSCKLLVFATVGLFVDQNSLKGSIPVEITDASLLEFLAFDGNDIEGSIPSEIGLLDLKEFTAAANRLTGSIPTEIVECSNLDFVLLDDNLLTGTIPARMGTLTRLAYLHLSVNDELQGVIPPTIGLLSNLVSFESSQTQLTGTIPIDLMSLTTLSKFTSELYSYVSSIQIDRFKPHSLLPAFYGCFYTASLSLGFNNFESAPLGSKVSQLRNLGKQFPNVCGHSPSYILTLVRRISVIARDKLDF